MKAAKVMRRKAAAETEAAPSTEEVQANCAKYGRLYPWAAAKTACPTGWRLPTREEWGALAKAAGGSGDYGASGAAGNKLKSKSGWENNGNGTDDFGFSALPGGSWSYFGGYDGIGSIGFWWTATSQGDNDIYYRSISSGGSVDEDSFNESKMFSVRCVADGNSSVSATPAAAPSAPADSKSAAEYVQRGTEYLDRGDKNRDNSDYDLAIAEFDQAIRLDQSSAAAYFGRGRGYLRKGDNRNAVSDYTQSLRLNPNDAIAYSNRGRAYARLGDYDNAVADFEAAFRIDPNNAAIKQNLEKARKRDKGL